MQDRVTCDTYIARSIYNNEVINVIKTFMNKVKTYGK